MDDLAKLISALASLAWPIVLATLLFNLYSPIRTLIESALKRKFTIKVAGNELTMEEASEQQRVIVNDIQSKLAELEKKLNTNPNTTQAQLASPAASSKRILWVDDNPKNNSFLIASLEERGVRVDTALSTDEGILKFKQIQYDIVLSDMGRPESERAGIDLAKKNKINQPKDTYVYFLRFVGSAQFAERSIKCRSDRNYVVWNHATKRVASID